MTTALGIAKRVRFELWKWNLRRKLRPHFKVIHRELAKARLYHETHP